MWEAHHAGWSGWSTDGQSSRSDILFSTGVSEEVSSACLPAVDRPSALLAFTTMAAAATNERVLSNVASSQSSAYQHVQFWQRASVQERQPSDEEYGEGDAEVTGEDGERRQRTVLPIPASLRG
jgi:hypothetical protein